MIDFGEKVSYYRKSKGLSIKKLAEDICDESTIYRLEKGKQLPRLEILNDICMKLEVPFKALFPLNEEVENLKKLCRELTYIEEYLALEITLEECSMVLQGLTPPYSRGEFNKFIQWHKAIIYHKKDNDIPEALRILDSLANIKNCGSELDVAILNSVALINLDIGNVDRAYKIYKLIYEKVKKLKIVEDSTLLPRVAYNYAFTLFKFKEYEYALKVALESLYYLETHYLNYSLGEFHHMVGVLSKKCGYFSEAEEAFQNAILLFTLTKNQNDKERAEKDLSNLLNEKDEG